MSTNKKQEQPRKKDIFDVLAAVAIGTCLCVYDLFNFTIRLAVGLVFYWVFAIPCILYDRGTNTKDGTDWHHEMARKVFPF